MWVTAMTLSVLKVLKWLHISLWVRSKPSQWSSVTWKLLALPLIHSMPVPLVSWLPFKHTGYLPTLGLILVVPSVQNLLQHFNIIVFLFFKHLLEEISKANSDLFKYDPSNDPPFLLFFLLFDLYTLPIIIF